MDDFKYSSEKRIYNLIWSAASDYTFEPLFKGKDISENPDFYFNIIIGLSYKYFEKKELEDLFSLWKYSRYRDRYDLLTWIGLENYLYNAEIKVRPKLAFLRKNYAKNFFDFKYDLNRRNFAFNNISLFMINSKHMANILEKDEKGLTTKEKNLLNDLYKDFDLKNKNLSEIFTEIYRKHFNFDKDIEKKSKNITIFRNHFDYKSSHSFERPIKPSTFGNNKDSVVSKNPIKVYKFRKNEKKRIEIERIFGKSIFDQKTLEKIEISLCKEEDKLEKLRFTKRKFEDIKDKETLKNIKKSINSNKNKYDKNKRKYELTIKNLSKKLDKILKSTDYYNSYFTNSGRISHSKLFKTQILGEDKIFYRKEEEFSQNLSIDLFLDSSASVMYQESEFAISAYILAKSLELVGIKIRILSFLSYDYYTIINILKDFDEKLEKDRIFSFNAMGFNRDSLALKAYMQISKTNSKRLMLILTDANPSDIKPIYKKSFRLNKSYDGIDALKLTKKELLNLKNHNIYPCGIIKTSEDDKNIDELIKRAKFLFSNKFTKITSPLELSSKASFIIRKELKKIQRKNRL